MRLIISFRFSKNGFRSLLYFCSTLRISSDAFSFNASISFWQASICSNDSDSTSLNPSSIKKKTNRKKKQEAMKKKIKFRNNVDYFQNHITAMFSNGYNKTVYIYTDFLIAYNILNIQYMFHTFGLFCCRCHIVVVRASKHCLLISHNRIIGI